MDSNRRGSGGDTDGGGREERTQRGDGDREHEATFKRNDWLCHMCSAHNFARNIHCFKCHQVKGSWDGESSSSASDAAAPDKEKRGMRKADWRRADWKCASCGYVNFARRTHCNSCSLPKAIDHSEEEAAEEAATGSGEDSYTSAKGGGGSRGGGGGAAAAVGGSGSGGGDRSSSAAGGRGGGGREREGRSSGSHPFRWVQRDAVEEVVRLLQADLTGEWMARSRGGDLPLFYNCITVRVVQWSGRHSKASRKAEKQVERAAFDVERLMRAVAFYFERVREAEESASAVFSKPPPSEFVVRGALGAAVAVAEKIYRDVSGWMHQQYGLCEKILYTIVLSAEVELVIELADGPSIC